MANVNTLDEIEVIDLEEHCESGKPIPKRVKYFLIKVDKNKYRVQSPITGKQILTLANLDSCEYGLVQKFRGGRRVELDLDCEIDLTEHGVERFKSIKQSEAMIIVNGRQKDVDDKKLSFSQILSLAFDNPPTGENTCITMTYRNGPPKRPEGSLVEGDQIKIECGMVFNVTATDKS